MRPDEAFRIPLESLAENNLALGDDLISPVVVEHFRREQTDAAVVVLGVVPEQGDLAERAGILDRAEPFGGNSARAFQGFELAFRERVVIGDVRAAMGLGDAEVGQKQSHGLGRYRGAAAGMDRKLIGGDVLLAAVSAWA